HIVSHLVLDRRDRRTLLCAARTGHLGPTVFRSDDLGKSWKEASRPPAFPASDPLARSVKHTFWLEPGPTDQPDVWYAGAGAPAPLPSGGGGGTRGPGAGFHRRAR